MVLTPIGCLIKNFSPTDVPVQGITRITLSDIEKRQKEGKVLKLIGECRMEKWAVRLQSRPKRLEMDHPLAAVKFFRKRDQLS
jgi:homoserine dehydrogenase